MTRGETDDILAQLKPLYVNGKRDSARRYVFENGETVSRRAYRELKYGTTIEKNTEMRVTLRSTNKQTVFYRQALQNFKARLLTEDRNKLTAQYQTDLMLAKTPLEEQRLLKKFRKDWDDLKKKVTDSELKKSGKWQEFQQIYKDTKLRNGKSGKANIRKAKRRLKAYMDLGYITEAEYESYMSEVSK